MVNFMLKPEPMKTHINIKKIKKHRIAIIQFITIFLMFSIIGQAQKSKEISLSVYPGYTLVDFEEALDYSDEYLEDWGKIYLGAALRGFLQLRSRLQLGAEVAWQQLYYAYYRLPYGPSPPVYREFNVTTVSLMALSRYYLNNRFFIVGGAGVHIFNDGVSPSVCLEPGYMIEAGNNLTIPVSFRINPVFGSGTPILFSVGAGVSYNFATNYDY